MMKKHPYTIARFLTFCLLVGPTWGQSEFDEYTSGLPSLGYASFLLDVSSDGRTILGQGSLPDVPYLIVQGVTQGLPQGNYSFVVGSEISDNGRVAVATGYLGPERAIKWTDGNGPTVLGLPAGAPRTFAGAVNADGSVIAGYAISSQGDFDAIRWVDDVPSVVAPPTGVPFVTFSSVSFDGTEMAGNLNYNPSGPVSRAVRWSETGGYTMLEFPAGSNRSIANDMSELGSIVVGAHWATTTDQRAVYWDAAGTLTTIADPTWILSAAVGIDSAGRTILVRGVTGSEDATFLYDVATGAMTPLVDLLGATGGPALPLAEVSFPAALAGDGSMAIGSRFGDPYDPDYTLWAARMNSFGTKVCGPAFPSSAGVSASLLGSGSLSIASNNAALTATNLPSGQFGMFLASRTLGLATGGSNPAVLCLSGDIGRYNAPGQIGMVDAAGRLSLSLDHGSIPQPMGSVAAIAGETWYFQAWFRDVVPTSTWNFTDALCVTLTQ